MKIITILFAFSFFLGGFIVTTALADTNTTQTNPQIELIEVLGCKGCHVIAGKGGSLAVSLDHIGTRLTVSEIETRFIHDSHDKDGEKFMPSYKNIPASDMKDISSFLYNQ